MQRFFKIIFLTLIVILNNSNYINAQIAGNDVSDAGMGIEFNIPDGWMGQKIDGGYLLGSNTIKGFILITYHQYKSTDELRAEATHGIIDENGTNLQLEGSLNLIDKNGLAGEFTGTVEWQQAKAYVASIISSYGGGGITVIAAVEAAGYNKDYPGYVESIIQSAKFSKPKVTPIAEQWKERLNDCRLTYMNSYDSGYGSGGYQDKTIIDLCSRGYFNYNDHSETVVNAGDYAGGYSTGSSAGSGQWTVINRGNQAILQLNFNGGEVYEYTLTDQDGKTYLNDYRYFRTYSDSSVESGKPNCW